MLKLNTQRVADSSQRPIDGIKEESLLASSAAWSIGFHYPPQCFCYIQVQGILRKIKKESPRYAHNLLKIFIFLSQCTLSCREWRMCLFWCPRKRIQGIQWPYLSQRFLVMNPWWRLFQSIMPKMLTRCAFWDGTYTSSSRNCHP